MATPASQLIFLQEKVYTMASISNPIKPTKPVLKPKVIVQDNDEEVVETTTKAVKPVKVVKEAKAVKEPKEPKPAKEPIVYEKDEVLDIPRRNVSGFRWVCIDVLREMWTGPETDVSAMADRCIELAAERNAPKAYDADTWVKQLSTLRAWLRQLKSPMPGDERVEKTPEQKKAMADRLKAGKARKAKAASIDDDAEGEAVNDE